MDLCFFQCIATCKMLYPHLMLTCLSMILSYILVILTVEQTLQADVQNVSV